MDSMRVMLATLCVVLFVAALPANCQEPPAGLAAVGAARVTPAPDAP